MIEILTCEQNSPEWQTARMGIPTASEFKSILAKGQGKTRRTYMMKLLGERLTGKPMESYTNHHMDRGHDMEAEARRDYMFVMGEDAAPVGFIRNGKMGCSPDSLVGDRGLLEVKTKAPHLQAEVLIAGKLPTEHKAQVQGQIWVAERDWCDFVSYWPGMPPFIIRVERDEKYIEVLSEEVARFSDELEKLEDQVRHQYNAPRLSAVDYMAAG